MAEVDSSRDRKNSTSLPLILSAWWEMRFKSHAGQATHHPVHNVQKYCKCKGLSLVDHWLSPPIVPSRSAVDSDFTDIYSPLKQYCVILYIYYYEQYHRRPAGVSVLPPKMTRPKHHSVFRSVQPLSRILSLSSAYVCPSTVRVPLNLSSRLLGGSQCTSPGEHTFHIKSQSQSQGVLFFKF